jgi:hypothetical protein
MSFKPIVSLIAYGSGSEIILSFLGEKQAFWLYLTDF